MDGKILGAGFEKWRDGVRLVPAKEYSIADAPLGHKFAVFVDGKQIAYDKSPDNLVEVARLSDDSFMSVCGYTYSYWLRRYKLPDDAKLVAIGTCTYKATIDDAVKLPVLEKTDVWKMFHDAGATLMRGTQWNGEPEYDWVWLPVGWKVVPKVFAYDDRREEIVIDNTGAERARAIWVTLDGRKGGGISLMQPFREA